MNNSQERTILITGGTGSFGYAFTRKLLQQSSFERIIIFSRDEMKQWEMQAKFEDFSDRLRFFIGDVRDEARLKRAFSGVDVVVHAAALKIVQTAEYNPFDCIKTNIMGAMNVANAAIDSGVKKVIALSTDKASSPVNLYGATKLCSDKVMVGANSYSGDGSSRFSVVRYGNVMGSRGSLLRYLHSLRDGETVTLTDQRMTRFMLDIEDATELVLKVIETMRGGEIVVKKCPTMKVVDVISALRPDSPIKVVGIRPGEKLHEEMVSSAESLRCADLGDRYVIMPPIPLPLSSFTDLQTLVVEEGFSYNSETNPDVMTSSALLSWYRNNLEFLK